MNREQYVEKLTSQLELWSAKIDALEAKAHEARADLRVRCEQQLQALREQREHAALKLREVQSASAAAWQELAGGADQAWRELCKAFERARDQFDAPKEKDGR